MIPGQLPWYYQTLKHQTYLSQCHLAMDLQLLREVSFLEIAHDTIITNSTCIMYTSHAVTIISCLQIDRMPQTSQILKLAKQVTTDLDLIISRSRHPAQTPNFQYLSDRCQTGYTEKQSSARASVNVDEDTTVHCSLVGLNFTELQHCNLHSQSSKAAGRSF